jgi:hypothetical protein
MIVIILLQSSFLIYEGISGSVVSYTVHFLSILSLTFPIDCMDDVCEYMVEVPPTVCQTARDHDVSMIDISVSAANRLGSGPLGEFDPIG